MILFFASIPISAEFFLSALESSNCCLLPSAFTYQTTPCQQETIKSLPEIFSIPSVPPSIPSLCQRSNHSSILLLSLFRRGQLLQQTLCHPFPMSRCRQYLQHTYLYYCRQIKQVQEPLEQNGFPRSFRACVVQMIKKN